MMNQNEMLYTFEHKLLPRWFFEDKAKFVVVMLAEDDMLFNMYNGICEKKGEENPYTPEEFGTDRVQLADDTFMIKLKFPEPESMPLCYCAYAFFDEKFTKLSYFTVERGFGGNDGHAFVCSWTPDGIHQNHGQCSFEENGDFVRCSEVYFGK